MSSARSSSGCSCSALSQWRSSADKEGDDLETLAAGASVAACNGRNRVLRSPIANLASQKGMTMTSSTSTTRIYVASLSDYNAGRLHGVWIDADQDIDSIWEQVNAMLKASPEFRAFPQGGPAEEWAIHDYEGFGPWSLSEWESFEHVALVAEGIAEHGLAFAAWVSNDGSVLQDTDYDSLSESFRESYGGCHDSERAYAEYLVEELGLPGIGMNKLTIETYMGSKEIDILDELSSYLDWDALTRWALEDCWTYTDDEYNVHVFRSV